MTAATASPAPSIVAVGMFDGVHAGHRHLLAQLKAHAAERGLRPVAISFANHPMEEIAPHRAPALLSTPEAKLAALQAEGVEAHIIPFDHALRMTSAEGFLRLIRDRYGAQAMLLGFNNRFGHDAPTDFATYAAIAARCGVELLQASEYPSLAVSSSVVRAMLLEGRVADAATLLGHPYTLTGTVTPGQQLGRTIGFPTANLLPLSPRLLIPANGVYACLAHLSPTDCPSPLLLPAVVNIGTRPTIDPSSTATRTIEAHIINFSGNLYSTTLTLQFLHRIRSEERFPTLAALQAQIARDREAALTLLAPHLKNKRLPAPAPTTRQTLPQLSAHSPAPT